MDASYGMPLRVDAAPDRTFPRPTNAPRGGLYVSRWTVASPAPQSRRPPRDEGGHRLRTLAREGSLVPAAAAARGAERVQLTGAAYGVCWPIVFSRLTRRLEQSRGHLVCASGVDRLAAQCLDRFYDDVEAVVEDLLAHARHPVLDLEGWIASRLQAATVDGHRRMRGRRGALQRPRLPIWLAQGLEHDPWLTALAVEILVWVGVSATAGAQIWPLESWAYRRGMRTGDWLTSDPARVATEVETVLAVMRRRPDWYESYVEQPLGAKQAPVAAAPLGDTAAPLDLGDGHDQIDSELLRLAAEAVQAIDARITAGGQAEAIVVDVIRTVFGGPFTGTLDRAPHTVADPVGGLSVALADPGKIDRIVGTVLSILGKNNRDPRDPPSRRAPS
ncbi:MAG: hypothetical protein QOH97_2604 [Actinoplanes sp.]|nr:hypothetical protein [Actinoplanes sp.]